MRPAASLANLKPAWTPEDAAAAARRGWEKRRANPKPKQPDTAANKSFPEPTEDEPDLFHARKLRRVRAQWDALDRMIAAEDEPAKLDRLIAALARIEEIERRLSARSLPPTLRAGKSRQTARPLAQPFTQPPPIPQPQPVVAQDKPTPPVQVVDVTAEADVLKVTDIVHP
jgi:hypothetical protein